MIQIYHDKRIRRMHLNYFEGVYRPNDGIDYTKDNESFDVLCKCKWKSDS